MYIDKFMKGVVVDGVYNTYNIQFINEDGLPDETQYSASSAAELKALYKEFCKENHITTNTVTGVEWTTAPADTPLPHRARKLLFDTLELLRKEICPKFADWKDADDWLFAKLDFTKSELSQIYDGRDTLYYDGSAVDL